MGSFFYNLGRKAGPKIRKGKWLWQTLTGTEEETIAAEFSVGRDLVEEIKTHLTISTDEPKRQLIHETGKKLTRRVANKLRKFHFQVIQEGKPNAFALPGGFIFITASLIELCKEDNDAIAFVLAHEMSHVIRGHAIDRLIKNSAINIVSRTSATRGALAAWIKRVGIAFVESAYSRDNEIEADSLGARLTKAAGYDTQGAVRLFQRLAEITDKDEISLLGEYFSTHPKPALRIQNIKTIN